MLVLLLFPLLVGLGLWQLDRYQQKQVLEQLQDQRRQMPPVTALDQLVHYPDPLYLPVDVQGRFVKNRYFLLDNQVFKGRVGYELLMPFITGDGQWLLVNRGWLPADQSGSVTTMARQYRLRGSLYRLQGRPFLLAEDRWQDGWPKVIQAVDFDRINRLLAQTMPPVLLRLNHDDPAALQMRPVKTTRSSARHLGYAVQWFTMALVLLGLYGWQIRTGE